MVVSVGGEPVSPDATLSYLVSNAPIGSRVPVELIRDGRRQTVTVVVGERPPEEQLAQRLGGNDNDNFGTEDDGTGQRQAATASLGLAVQPLTAGIARQIGVPAGTRGVVIGAVDPSSDAATKGLQRGDVISAANGRPVATAEEFRAAVAEAGRTGRTSVLLLVQRGNTPARYIGLRIKAG